MTIKKRLLNQLDYVTRLLTTNTALCVVVIADFFDNKLNNALLSLLANKVSDHRRITVLNGGKSSL